jgi:hypothetical protein
MFHAHRLGLIDLSVVLALAAIIFSQNSLAHHSGAMFDRSKVVELRGTVKEYQFANPHVWIEMMVPEKNGREVQWSIEGEGPGMMARIGLGRTVLKAGDKVFVRAHPLRDGRSGGSFVSITLADGKTIDAAIPPPGAR